MKSVSNKTQQIALVILLLILVVIMAIYQSASVGSDAAIFIAPSKLEAAGAAFDRVGDDNTEGPALTARCVTCHGELGIANVQPPVTAGTTVLVWHPADAEASIFAANLAHSSKYRYTPGGTSPALHRLPYRDTQRLNDQNIRTVLAFMTSLNQK